MTNYTRIRRQILALLAGALVAIPIALVAVIITPSRGPEVNIGAAGHSEYGAIILAILLALHAISFLATALNTLFSITACIVLCSLAFDAYKLHSWRSSKSVALLAGSMALSAIWLYLASQPENDLVSTGLAPSLASFVALVLIFVILYLGRKSGAENAGTGNKAQ